MKPTSGCFMIEISASIGTEIFFYSINSTFSFKNSIIMENNVTPFYGKTHADCL